MHARDIQYGKSRHWSLLIPLENIRKPLAFDAIRGYRKKPVARNGLKKLSQSLF